MALASRMRAQEEEPEAAAHKRGVETRHDIDRTATELFARLGYHATSMRAIAAAANVQPAAIYHWYPNKEAILVHLQDEFMRELTDAVQAAVNRQDDATHRLAAAVREHVVFHGRHQQEAFVTDSEIRALEPTARAALIAQRDDYQRYFHDLIEDGASQGQLHPMHSLVATYAILLQCTGVALWFSSNGPLPINEVANQHVDLVLGSLHADRTLIADAIAAIQPP